jgi:hypothetical protein
LYINRKPIRAGLAERPEDAEYTSRYARLQDRLEGDGNLQRSGWLAPVQVDGDGYDGGGAPP